MYHIKLPVSSAIEPNILRVLSYNVQVGIRTTRPSHYLTGSWKHLFPHSKRLLNLDEIVPILTSYDIVGLQEVDAGSLRSNFINLTEYLAERSLFPYWYHQVNRNLGKVAQHSNGLLSEFQPNKIKNIKLPGLIPGRQAILAIYGSPEEELAVFVLHMALSRRARLKQFDYISDLVNEYPHAIVMGDLNCRHDSPEMQLLFKRTNLHEPLQESYTFPSWQPQHPIDHILVTSGLKVKNVDVLIKVQSDHLPISMEIELPPSMSLERLVHEPLPVKEKNKAGV